MLPWKLREEGRVVACSQQSIVNVVALLEFESYVRQPRFNFKRRLEHSTTLIRIGIAGGCPGPSREHRVFPGARRRMRHQGILFFGGQGIRSCLSWCFEPALAIGVDYVSTTRGTARGGGVSQEKKTWSRGMGVAGRSVRMHVTSHGQPARNDITNMAYF